MMMASVEQQQQQQQPGRRLLEPPSSSTATPTAQDLLFSPMSYSRSVSSATPSFQNMTMMTPGSVPPPPPSTQKSILRTMMQEEGMAGNINISVDNGEISRLLSLSGGGTPRSILANLNQSNSSTERMKQDLQEVLEYIDGMHFVTPFKKSSNVSLLSPMPSMPSITKTDGVKPPRHSSGAVLADRSNQNRNTPPPFSVDKSTSTTATTPWKMSTTTSARDPTPSKPKLIGLDLLRENPSFQPMMMMNHHHLMTPSSTTPLNDQSSLVVEVSHSTQEEEEEAVAGNEENNHSNTHSPHDPPVDDSKIIEEWASPPRRRVPMEPEQTQTPRGGVAAAETSILLGTAFADYDLMPPRNTRPTPIRTRWATPVQEETAEDDEEESEGGYQPEEESYFATAEENDDRGLSLHGPFATGALQLPATPGLSLVDEAKWEELQSRGLPQSPRDAKEWLQTAVLALQDARAERDAARKWARDMKEAVYKWAEEQRKLIRCEASTRMDVLHEQEHQIHTQTEALATLQELVLQLHAEFQSTHSERQASESQTQKLILEQQERIHFLSRQLSAMEQTVSEGMSQAANNRLTPKSGISNSSPVGGTHNGHDPAFPQFVDRPVDMLAAEGAAPAEANNNNTASSQKSVRSTSSTRVRKPLPGGKGHVIVYSSGVEKELHDDGTTVVRYTNGDVETNFGNSTTVAYFHATEQILQVTNRQDGSVLFEYPNGQIERHYANGVKAILFPDGTKAKISADGKVETYERV